MVKGWLYMAIFCDIMLDYMWLYHITSLWLTPECIVGCIPNLGFTTSVLLVSSLLLAALMFCYTHVNDG